MLAYLEHLTARINYVRRPKSHQGIIFVCWHGTCRERVNFVTHDDESIGPIDQCDLSNVTSK